MSVPTAALAPARSHQFRNALILLLCAETAAVLAFGAVYSWAWGSVDMVLLGGVGWRLWKFALGGDWEWPPALWPGAAFAALVAWQWLWLDGSVVPAATLTAGLQLAGAGACLLMAVYAFGHERNMVRLGYWAWIFSGLLGLEAILQYYTGNFNIYWFSNAFYGSPFGPYVNRNDYAGMIELLLPLALVTALLRIERRHAAFVSFTNLIPPAIAFSSVVLSASRTGTAVASAELVVVVTMFLRSRHVIAARRLVPVVVGMMLLYAGAVGMTPFLSRLSATGSMTAGPRQQVLLTSLRAWKAHPWTGTGLGTFRWVYPQYQQFDDGLIWDHAHDDWAELLVETGAVGMILALSFAGFLVRAALRFDWSATLQLYKAAASVGAIGLMAHALLDFQFHIPANCLGFFMLAGVAMSRSRSPARRRSAPVYDPNLELVS